MAPDKRLHSAGIIEGARIFGSTGTGTGECLKEEGNHRDGIAASEAFSMFFAQLGVYEVALFPTGTASPRRR